MANRERLKVPDAEKKTMFRVSTCYEGRIVTAYHDVEPDKALEWATRFQKKGNEKGDTAAYIMNPVTRVVQIIYGSIEPFRKGLDKNFPGWTLGKVI